MKARYFLILLTVFAVACGEDAGLSNNSASGNNSVDGNNASTGNNSAAADAGDAGATSPDAAQSDAEMLGEPPAFLAEGTDRQTPVFVPSDYDPSGSYPLVVLLHGYTSTGLVQESYFNLTSMQEEYDFVFLRPDGTRDAVGNQFWNATEFCCDFNGTMVDDEGYLVDLLEEAGEKLAIDPSRVYFVGHSNGGFMSYRMACNHGDKIAAIVSLAGANFTDPQRCDSDTPVAVAQAHGTADTTIQYGGNSQYPGSAESLEPWRVRNGCGETLEATGETLDLDSVAPGEETSVESFGECSSGFAVERWTMDASGHIPGLRETWPTAVLDFLYRHSRD